MCVSVKFPDDWDILTRINYLQRKIIISSIAYYELDEPFMSDYRYDGLVQLLKELMDNCAQREQSRYWYVFKEWTGATGAFLYSGLNREDKKALLWHTRHILGVVEDYRKENGK